MDLDFYPLQEQTPDPLSAARTPELTPGVWYTAPDHTPQHHPEATLTTSPALDPVARFAALPPAEQDAQLQAATARLLAQGLRRDVLIRPVLLAEVSAQLALPSPAAPPVAPRPEHYEACPCQKPHPVYFSGLYSFCSLTSPHVQWLSFYL